MSKHERQSARPVISTETVEAYSGALHEVSNALTVVLGWLDMASKATSLSDAQDAIRVAQEHARRGQAMARQGIGAEGSASHIARTASALAIFAATSMEPKAAVGKVKLRTDVGAGTDVRIDSDASVLQILTNLLLNAIDFSQPGSTVTVSVQRADSGLHFRVQDEGPGVPDAALAELFTTPTSTRVGGAGIGLPYSRALARNHDGDLRYVHKRESGNSGACFELAWPTARSSLVAPGPSQSVRDALKGARLLVIEDDVSIASLIELTFDAHGARVLALNTSTQVAETLASHPVFDAALVDLSPIKDNLRATLERMQELSPGAPIVLMSGEPGGVPEEVDGCFASWVRKPFDMDQLLATVGKLLQGGSEPGDSEDV